MKAAEIKKAYDAAVAERDSSIDQIWDLIERYVVPFRGDFYRDLMEESEIQWRRRKIYDGTAINAAQTLSASIQGTMTSPAIKWFELRFRKSQLNADNEARTWLEECEERMYHAFRESNFDTESSESYLDLVSFGNGVLVEEEDDSNDSPTGLDFAAIPVREAYFEEDHRGNVVRFYRTLNWTPAQIVNKFGEENVPDDIRQQYKANKTEKQKLVFAVFQRPDKKDKDTSRMLEAKERPYGYKYILHKDATEVGKEGGYYELPVYLTRWRKVAGSRWGHSPAFVVLSDILSLNELVEVMLEAAGKVVDPPTLTTARGLMSDLDLGRAGLTVVRNIDDVKPYESGARFDVADMKVDRLQNAINKAFYIDQLQLKESPAMTATEVSVRYEMMQRLMGPTMGRLQDDFLNPMIERTFGIMWRNGRLPDAPQIVQDQAADMDIEYTGPLPRSQKMETARQVQNWLAMLGSLAEIFPEIRDLPNVDEIGRGMARMEGVPARFVNDEDTVKQQRKERQEEERLARQLALAQQGGEAAKAVGEGMDKMAGEGKPNGGG